MSILVRHADGVDVERLLSLMREFNTAEGIPWDRDRFAAGLRRLLENPDLGFVLVAELALTDAPSQLQGYTVLTYGYDVEFGGRHAFLTELYVPPTYRRQGIGWSLLNRAESEARTRNVTAIHLLVYPENEAARALYRRADYVESPRIFCTKRL